MVNSLGLAQGLLAMAFAVGTMVLVMCYAHVILRKAGRIAPVVIARILMIFLAALGVEFIYRGLIDLFPQLAK